MIYARISDDRTGLAAGEARQEADARTLCERNGWTVVGVEVDNDISASRYSRKVRPAYQRVLAMARAGEVDVIACYDVDRLYRKPSELEELIDLAESTVIASMQGDLHLDTSDGRAMARVLCAMAAKSSDDTSRRVKRKHRATAEAGLPSGGGPRPFGFDDDKISVRESEAVRVREAAARILGGDTLGAICADWWAAGITTPKGNRWQTSALRRMLEAPRIAGLRSLGSEVVADAVWPAILDRETWEAVTATMHGRRPSMPSGYSARSYLLSGLIFCDDCGAPMTAQAQTTHRNGKTYRYRRYWCRRDRGGCSKVGISADRTEEVVIAAFVNRAALSGAVDPAGPIDLDASPSRRLVALQAEYGELLDLLDAGKLSPKSFALATQRNEAAQIEAQRQMGSAKVNADLSEVVRSSDPIGTFDSVPWDRKRAMLVSEVGRVAISRSTGRGAGFEKDRVHVTWREGV